MWRLFFIFTLLMTIVGFSQDVSCGFNIEANGKSLSAINNNVVLNNDTVIIEKIKFYISNVKLFKNNNEVWKDQQNAYLIDLSKKTQFELKESLAIDFDEIRFDLGIDSITNVSGAMGGDLDPRQGMYWSWQSGYINFKLEGFKNSDKTKKMLQFHLGGYLAPFNPLQSIVIKTSSSQINLVFDVERFLEGLDLTTQVNIMRPCKEGVELASRISKSIYLND